MSTIRIHSRRFRSLFYLYHMSGAIGFILLTTFIIMSAVRDVSNGILVVCGMLFITIPLMISPPEIIVHLKERRLIFRHKLTYLTADFKDVYSIETRENVMEIKDLNNNSMVEIQQDHFKNIPLHELKDYIGKILSGNADIDPLQYNSFDCSKCRTSAVGG